MHTSPTWEVTRLVDLRQLTALVTVAEVRSVTKAARLLHIVQPAVTRQIRTLEQGIAAFVSQGESMGDGKYDEERGMLAMAVTVCAMLAMAAVSIAATLKLIIWMFR